MVVGNVQGMGIDALVTISVTGEDSPMFGIPTTHLVEHQARLAGVPWVNALVDGSTPHDIDTLEAVLKKRNTRICLRSVAIRLSKIQAERMAQRLGMS